MVAFNSLTAFPGSSLINLRWRALQSPSSRLASGQNLRQRTPGLFMRWVLGHPMSQCLCEQPCHQNGTQHCNNQHTKVKVLNGPNVSIPMELQPAKGQVQIQMWTSENAVVACKISAKKDENQHHHERQSILKRCHVLGGLNRCAWFL
jgi:hypothetical protein